MSRPGSKAPTNKSGKPQQGSAPADEVMYTTVYTFVIHNQDEDTRVIYPRMAIRQTIANMRGEVDEETARVVDVAELDSMGFYNGDRKPGRP